MIKAITVTNHLKESIRLDLFNPQETGLIIQSIDGLGPVKANINFTEIATSDGAVENSARLGTRNIVLSLKFMGTPTIEDTRLLTYKYFPIKKLITFRIETDNRTCETSGRIESNEPSIFDKEEGCQISILCSDPYFRSAGEGGINETIFYGTEPTFTFPFCNNSLTENLIIFGEIRKRTEAVINYYGDAEVGITILAHAYGDVKGLKIYNMDTREMMSIDDEKLKILTGDFIKAGDEITIRTDKGNKGIYLLRSGELINILNVLGRPINWFQLSKGVNIFAYTADEGLENLQFEIENRTLYEGV